MPRNALATIMPPYDWTNDVHKDTSPKQNTKVGTGLQSQFHL